jgi:arsenical pump membrane protein
MSILFSNMLSNSSSSVSFHAIYASIIGSNIAAIFTPIGALAGMMWMSILKRLKIKMNFYDFLRFGIVIGLPILFVSLFILEWVV